MNTNSLEYSDRMKELAVRIGKLPATGMVEAECVNKIISETVEVLIETMDQVRRSEEFADKWMDGRDRLTVANRFLMQCNGKLAFLASHNLGTNTIEGNA